MQQNILPAQGDKVDYLAALELAIKREIKSKYAYQTIAKYTTSENLKRKLDFLAEEEQNHRANIEDLYKKISGTTRDFDSMVHLPDESVLKQDASLAIPELLKTAIEKEKESNEYYLALADTSEGDAYRELFRFLAEEEVTHRRMLEMELRLYTGELPAGMERSIEMVPDIYKNWW